ncbi:MAG: hypothetical protein MI866_05350 [Bacteroidales bacterium]|nr:hypothetical protein [Bacteroidales bacterium]
MRESLLLLVYLMISLSIQAQTKPKKIKSKSDYVHSETGFSFPLTINQLNRSEIYAFDKKRDNVGITYKTNDLKTTISIYLYPAGAGTEDRLRNEYIKSMQSVANISENGINAVQHAVSFKRGNYKLNGFKANIKTSDKESSLCVYECGEWFLKIRLSSEVLDSTGINQIEKEFLNLYKPTRLVKQSKLQPKASVYFAKTAFVDSLMLGSAMGSAYKKIDWAFENVDSLERASGFPGLYLDLHISSLKEFTAFQKKHPNMSATTQTKEYLAELNSIIDKGFLEEFIMEQFDMVMIVPKDLELDLEGFNKWKNENPIKINLNKRFYIISFEN